jgi:hypothetical protein
MKHIKLFESFLNENAKMPNYKILEDKQNIITVLGIIKKQDTMKKYENMVYYVDVDYNSNSKQNTLNTINSVKGSGDKNALNHHVKSYLIDIHAIGSNTTLYLSKISIPTDNGQQTSDIDTQEFLKNWNANYKTNYSNMKVFDDLIDTLIYKGEEIK